MPEFPVLTVAKGPRLEAVGGDGDLGNGQERLERLAERCK